MTDIVPSDWLLEPVDLNALDEHSRLVALKRFSDHIWSFYRVEGRQFPWRETMDPYHILLSELMLQQTQTERVLPKYRLFLEQWPDFQSMANSSLQDVLIAWRGLGYNRRALAIRTIAQKSESFGWTLPADKDRLLELPMVGPATAAAIMAFAYGQGSLYLETNVRRVLIHQFHPEDTNVRDKALLQELSALLSFQTDYKHWYYALMDYGVYLKRHLVNPNRRSAHYQKQGAFANSNRQIRGMILVAFTERGKLSLPDLFERLPFPPDRIASCLDALVGEGFVETVEQVSEESGPWYSIRSGS